MTFADPSLLLIGAVLTGLVLVGLWSHGARRRRFARFLGGRRAMDRISRSDLSRYGVRRVLLFGVAGLALSGAAADPRWIDVPEPLAPVKRAVVAIDVSASMQADDTEPTRLARAVDVARGLVEELEGEEVGLLLYAGQAYPLAPPTRDLDAVGFLLGGVTPTIASSYDPGTRMSAAIEAALDLFERGVDSTTVAQSLLPPPEQMIIFVSDGDSEGRDEELVDALARAEELGVVIHAVGVGTEEGAGMVMPRGTYQMGGEVVDESGAPAHSSLDPSTLRGISSEGNGLYAHADDADQVGALAANLRAPTVPPESSVESAPPRWTAYDLPFVLGALALALVFLESLIGMRLPRAAPASAREAA